MAIKIEGKLNPNNNVAALIDLSMLHGQSGLMGSGNEFLDQAFLCTQSRAHHHLKLAAVRQTPVAPNRTGCRHPARKIDERGNSKIQASRAAGTRPEGPIDLYGTRPSAR